MPQAHISLGALDHNLRVLRSKLEPETQLLAPVKANAYGHGAAATARHLESQGVSWFGVATRDEALELRRSGVSASILIFTPVYEGLAELVEYGVTLSVVDRASAELAIKAGRGATAHLKVDTGMGRLGGGLAETLKTAQRLDSAETVSLEGLWTHFACSDEADRSYTERQLERFEDTAQALRRAGVEVALKHTANSSATLAYPEAHFDLVRPGIALYGYHSSPHIARLEPGLEPALTLTAPVIFVKRLKKGQSVSYGALWKAPKDTTVATVRFGYADGYPRILSTTAAARVRVQGQLRPIVGRVCMDQLMVDVTGLEVSAGEYVTIFGPAGPTAEELGEAAGTISYELLTRLGSRVARRYA